MCTDEDCEDVSVVADDRGIGNHTRKGDAMPFSRCEWAIAERDSRTPATRDEHSKIHQCQRVSEGEISNLLHDIRTLWYVFHPHRSITHSQ